MSLMLNRATRGSLLLLQKSRSYARPAPVQKIDRKKELAEIMALDRMERRQKIEMNDIGQSFRVHTGNKYVKVQVKEEMVGCRYGEFAITRKRGPDSKPKPSKKRKL